MLSRQPEWSVPLCVRLSIGLSVVLSALPSGSARAQSLWFTLPAHPEPCRFDRFASALASLRPELSPKLGPAPSKMEISVTVWHEAGGWSLSVLAPEQAELHRSLPDPGSDCNPLSEAAAFMITRYLQDIPWHEAAPPQVVVPAAPSQRVWRGVTEAAVEGTVGLAGVTPAFALDFGVRRGAWEIDLGVAVATPARFTALSDDTYHDVFQTQAVRLELPLGRRVIALGPGALRLDLLPGTELDWTSDVSYAAASPGFTARAVAGARLGWEVAFGDRVALALRLVGRVLLGPQPGAPKVDDHDADDPAEIAADCGLSLAISYLVF